MVDRGAREQLASILRSYMNEEITAFELDERLDSFRRFPNDETVELIAADLWGCDDLKDHKVVATKLGTTSIAFCCYCHRMQNWNEGGMNFNGTSARFSLEFACC
jgi:hypothetical protein